MHLKNCFGYCIPRPGNSCCSGSNSRKTHSETINIDLVSSKPTCRKSNQMKRKSPEKSQQRITSQDTILGAIHTPALILFQDAKVMRSSKKMCSIALETIKALTARLLRYVWLILLSYLPAKLRPIQ